MELLIDLFGFINIMLRGAALTAEAFAVGGVAFCCIVLPAMEGAAANRVAVARMIVLLRISALVLAAVVFMAAAINITVLITTVDVSWRQAITAPFSVADAVIIAAALSVAAAAQSDRRNGVTTANMWVMMLSAIVMVVSTVTTTHAMGRLGDRAPLLLASALHQTGAFVWIGGIPYFLIALAGHDAASRARLASRFSRLCVAAVLAIAAAAAVYAVSYIGSFDAVYGTAYGAMVATKTVLFASLLFFGAANNFAVRRLATDDGRALLKLRRFAEVELGVGIAIFFVAAALTSLPPAVDLTRDRVTWQQVVDRVLTPRAPRLISPAHIALSIPMEQERLNRLAAAAREQAPQAYIPGSAVQPPGNAADIAWSEYNHNWSGILVLTIGLLALAWRAGWPPARHWPVLFVALAIFIAVRSDPEAWPLGDIGFLASMRAPEVLQHRLMTLLVAAFGIFEWQVRTGRLRGTSAAYVFPLSNALGGIMLLTHSHALSNIQEALLTELSHIPLGLLAISAGASRWLELRTEPPVRTAAAWIWPLCFIGVGVVLITYRES